MSAYEVCAYRSRETVDKGAYICETADTLTEAKRLARHFVTPAFRDLCETSTVMGHSQVRNSRGDVVFVCLSKGRAA